jgi:hypothetical protein
MESLADLRRDETVVTFPASSERHSDQVAQPRSLFVRLTHDWWL